MARARHVVKRPVIEDNERTAREAFNRGDYVLCFLLTHALIEPLLRAFLRADGSFTGLIAEYKRFLTDNSQPEATFVEELTKFNRRRNRVVHELWTKGYSKTNAQLECPCRGALIVYGLFIEWLETFDPAVTELGFEYEKPEGAS